MPTNQETIDTWIDAYVQAWLSPGTDELVNIFSSDATYSISPFKPLIVGLPAIEIFWEEGRNGPNEQFTIHHEVVAIEKNTAVVRVYVEYLIKPSTWKDLWILKFDETGLCTHFEEWPFTSKQFDGHE